MAVSVRRRGSESSWHKLLKSSRSAMKRLAMIASTLAKLGETHGELGDAVQKCLFLKMSLTMYAQVCPPNSDERDVALTEYFKAYQSLTASNPTQSRDLLEGTLQEGCLSSSDEFLAV
eukprot:5475894-Amphidinium_carterae.1